MVYLVYILYSKKTDKYYTGSTSDLNNRLIKHNLGGTASTRSGRPWIIVYTETCNNKTDALIRERKIKKMKSRKYIENLIDGNSDG